jgi:hypothetical protein
MLSAIFTSVADAIISYVIDKLDPAERIKSWLRLDPARLAFKKALARAYSAFARQYPEYTSSLFDQSFLSTDALPELSKLLTRNQHPDPALLAQAWRRSLGTGADFAQAATKPAAYFLERFEAELKAEPALQSIFDSRALESLPELEANIQQLSAELQRGLDTALKAASDYQKVTLHIGGDIKDSNIIIGDNNVINNYYYSGDFVSLNEYYIPPDGVFQRVQVDEFVGRDWLTAKVDAFLNDPNHKSGAFLLIGDAGVGKTSFMAHLVKERRYLHLFAEQASGQAMLQRAMQSLGSQLVTRYQIAPYKDRNTLSALSVFPDFLERILRLAASTLTEGEKIVIVCDALDEAGTFPDHFVFGLPKELPDGVYFILSQRPVNVKLPNFEPVIEKLEAQGEGNLQDIESYLSAVAKRPEVAGQIRSKEYSEDFFIQTLKEKSQGVWMYLHYVIKEIESGAHAPLDLANLPIGLVGYYAEYWDAWRTGKRGKGEEAWDDLYALLLTTLAAAQETISVETLIQWADVTAKPREVTRLLTEHWRAFVTEKENDGQKTYTPYHLSFKDFITGRVDTSKLPPAQANLVKDLAAQAVDVHKRIVSAFETECNGEWEKLVEQDYGRLHLSAHMNGAEEYEKLRVLLTEGDENIKWAEARLDKEGTYTGYLSDLVYIRDHACQKKKTDLLIRCTLIESSIRSWLPNIPPELLAEAAKAGLWSYARCLAAIRQNINSPTQILSMMLLAKHIPAELHQKAFSIASEIKEPTLLIYLALHFLDDGLLEKAISLSIKINGESKVADELCTFSLAMSDKDTVGISLDDELRLKALSIAGKLNGDSHFRARVLIDFASRLNNDKLKYDLVKEALDIAKNIIKSKSETHAWLLGNLITNESLCADILLNLAPHINNDEQKEEALSIIDEIKDEYSHARALIALAPYLNIDLKDKALQRALPIARKIKAESDRANVLTALLPNLNDETKEKVLQEVLSITREIKDEPDHGSRFRRGDSNESKRINALVALMPPLNKELKEKVLQEALSITDEIKDKSTRINALSAIASQLDGERKAQVLQEALTIAGEIKEESKHVNALITIAPCFDNLKQKTRILQKALSMMGVIKEVEGSSESPRYPRSEVFKKITPLLINNDHLQQKALFAIDEFESSSRRAKALIALVPYLNSENIKEKAFYIASEIKISFNRVEALAALAPRLGEKLKDKALQIALRAVDEIYESESDDMRFNSISVLAPLLDNTLKTKALSIVTNNDGEVFARSITLTNLAPHFNDEELKANIFQYVLSITDKIASASIRTLGLTLLASQINDDELKLKILQKAISSAGKIEVKDNSRIFVLITLAHNLNNDDLKSKLLQDAISAIGEIEYESKRFAALTSIIPHLNNDKLKKASLSLIGDIEDESDRIEVLVTLMPHLKNDGLKENVLSIIDKIESEGRRAEALAALAPYLNSDELQAQALSRIGKIKNEYYRVEAFVPLVLLLRSDKLRAAAITMIGNDTKEVLWRASVLTVLAPLFEDKTKSIDALQEALSNANKVESVYWRAYVLTALAPLLEDKLQPDIFKEAFSVAKEIEDGYWRASILTTLAQKINDELKQKVLEEAILSIVDIDDYKSRLTKVLTTLAPLLNNDEMKNKALSMIGKIKHGSDRASALIVFAPYLNSDELRTRAFEIVEKIDSESSRTYALTTLILQFNGITWSLIIQQNINSYIAVLGKEDRASALLGIHKILPALVHFSGEKFAEELLRGIEDTARWWP